MGTRADYVTPSPHVERAAVTTDASGNATFTWSAGAFTAPPVVAVSVQAGAGFYSARISSNTAAVTQVSVLVAAGVTLLGIGVLATGAPAAGVTVHAVAVQP